MWSESDIETLKRMKAENATWKLIAIALGRKKEAVRKFWQRYQKVADLPPKTIVRNTITSGRIGAQIKRAVRDNPKTSVKAIRAVLVERNTAETPIPSLTSIRRHLNKSGVVYRKLPRKQLISNVNVKKRLDFAKDGIRKPPDFWEGVIWSDETTVRSMPQKKEVSIWTSRELKREELPINPQVQAGGISVMFWGYIHAGGLGPLVAVEGSMKAAKYIKILQDNLVNELDVLEEAHGAPMTFMQDNAPCHKAKVVMDFLAEKGIATLDWPPQSPDLNPIENLWAIIKRRRDIKFPHAPTSRDELINQIFDIWGSATNELAAKLCGSMDNRLKAVIRNKGKNTKY